MEDKAKYVAVVIAILMVVVVDTLMKKGKNNHKTVCY